MEKENIRNLIKKHFNHENGSGLRSSVRHYAETGHVSGTLLLAIESFIKEFSDTEHHRQSPDSLPGEPEWVVNDNAELGVKIGEKFYWLYKGWSLQYTNNQHDNGAPIRYRPVYKREFGECYHPIHLKVLPEVYEEGEGWKDCPQPPTP